MVPRPYVSDLFYSLSSIHNTKRSIYTKVLLFVPLFGSFECADLTFTHVLLQKHSFQGPEPLLKSRFVPRGTCWCIENNRWERRDTEFLLECSTRYLMSERSGPVRYRVEHEKRNSTSPSNHVLVC